MERRRQPPKQITVDSSHEGQRIDNYLLTALKGVPRHHVYRLLRKGEVRVNKGRIRPSYRLQHGDIVRIPPVATDRPHHSIPSPQLAEVLLKSILYEDNDLLIVNKPSGIAVHGGSGIQLGVIEAFRILRPQDPDLELVHRLDRATSGCLVLAKSREALLELHGLLRTNEIDKRYLTLVKGRWQIGSRSIAIPLRKNRLQSGERMVLHDAKGKTAISYFHPVNVCDEASLMEVKLMTGRMHQIRVHAAQQGYPIAGDDKYGDRTFNLKMRSLGLKRLFLHACSIEFAMRGKSHRIVVKAPLPYDLHQVLSRVDLSGDCIHAV